MKTIDNPNIIEVERELLESLVVAQDQMMEAEYLLRNGSDDDIGPATTMRLAAVRDEGEILRRLNALYPIDAVSTRAIRGKAFAD